MVATTEANQGGYTGKKERQQGKVNEKKTNTKKSTTRIEGTG